MSGDFVDTLRWGIVSCLCLITGSRVQVEKMGSIRRLIAKSTQREKQVWVFNMGSNLQITGTYIAVRDILGYLCAALHT